jgi:hypothetical protein
MMWGEEDIVEIHYQATAGEGTETEKDMHCSEKYITWISESVITACSYDLQESKKIQLPIQTLCLVTNT